jgi:hypothetical protein
VQDHCKTVTLYFITQLSYNNPRVPESRPESHQNCERLRPGGLSPEIKVSTLRHLITCQAVVLHSEIKVTFDLHNFSFASPLSHVWVTNPYPQHGDTTGSVKEMF